jgi:lysozyme family protein
MTNSINKVIEDVLANEGGYVNNPNDRGGETNFGITIATARANGFTGSMKSMTRDFARDVYRKQYVTAPGFDKIDSISPPIAAELVDTGVNMGPKVPGVFLQRALNGLNNGGKDFADVVVDGACGPATRAALTAFLKKRGTEGERRLLLLLNAMQGERYLTLAEGRAANEAFLYGWLARVA